MTEEPTTGNRIEGETASIDYASTLRFFERRAARYGEVGPLSVTMYQDHDPDLAAQRDRWEQETVLSLLALQGTRSVLDIGCGVGRWAGHLEPFVAAYLGIDFSAGLLDIARQRASLLPAPERFRFQRVSAADIERVPLALSPPFDLILVAGVLVYLNDEDCAATLDGIAALSAPSASVYVREPMAKETRLTLERFYSSELRDQYSAIYRTQEQYSGLFEEHLLRRGFECAHSGPLFPEGLHNRRETAQRVYLFRRGA